MARVTVADVAGTIEELQAQIAELSKRIVDLEGHKAAPNGHHLAPAPLPPAEPVAAGIVAAGITEEELLAISAAVGAFLGVRAHIRQIRLLSSSAWAQQGRVSIQASHRLQG